MKIEDIIPAYELLQSKICIDESIIFLKQMHDICKDEEEKDVYNQTIIQQYIALDNILEKISNI